jgi:hypothetical protein
LYTKLNRYISTEGSGLTMQPACFEMTALTLSLLECARLNQNEVKSFIPFTKQKLSCGTAEQIFVREETFSPVLVLVFSIIIISNLFNNATTWHQIPEDCIFQLVNYYRHILVNGKSP